MSAVTPTERVRAAIRTLLYVVSAVADTIRELGSVPSGHLYAQLMGVMSLEAYEDVISNIVATGRVRRDANHLLVWVGPSGSPDELQSNQQHTASSMNITIANNATSKSIQQEHPAPRGSTHFRFTTPGRKPVIDKLANLDTLAGCSGKLEFGKVEFEGRGRYAKIKAFLALAAATMERAEEPAVPPVEAPEEPQQSATAAEQDAQQTSPVTPEAKQPSSKARKNKVLGHSACAVAKALGKAGVKYEEADRIFRAHGIEMPKASLSVQLGFGRNEAAWERHGKPAELTDAQITELRAGVAA